MKTRTEELEEANEFCEALNVKVKHQIDQLKIDNLALMHERALMIDAFHKILGTAQNMSEVAAICNDVLDIVCSVKGVSHG